MRTVEDIKKYLKANKITYKELSAKSGIPEGTLKNIFSKSKVTKNPRIDTINSIEKALGLDKENTIEPKVAFYRVEDLTEENIKDVQKYIDFLIQKEKK